MLSWPLAWASLILLSVLPVLWQFIFISMRAERIISLLLQTEHSNLGLRMQRLFLQEGTKLPIFNLNRLTFLQIKQGKSITKDSIRSAWQDFADLKLSAEQGQAIPELKKLQSSYHFSQHLCRLGSVLFLSGALLLYYFGFY